MNASLKKRPNVSEEKLKAIINSLGKNFERTIDGVIKSESKGNNSNQYFLNYHSMERQLIGYMDYSYFFLSLSF